MAVIPVKVLDPSKSILIIVGVGGTGGYVLQQVARLLYALKEQNQEIPQVVLADGDEVEEKNLLRQYFLPQDVERKKAEVLAERYSRAYGLDIMAYPEYITYETDFTALGVGRGYGTNAVTPIVLGCVDNTATRLVLHRKLQELKDVVYIDSGNDAIKIPEDPEHLDRYQLARMKDTGWEGQVCVGVRSDGEDKLPFPGEVFPDLIEVIEGEDKLPTDISCGEEVVSNPQRLMTNLMAATSILVYLHTLLVDGTLLHHRSYFDARRAFVRSEKAIDHLLEVAL